jgi:hypothetical protein
MALRETIALPHARVEVEVRAGFLYLVETGTLKSIAESTKYFAAMEDLIMRTGVMRAIIDARGEVGDPPPEVRNAMWAWLAATDRGFQMVAFILPSEMAVARVNMTALSRRAHVRAFDNLPHAQRWLVRGPRQSSVTMQALTAEGSERSGSSTPPPPPPSSERPARDSEFRARSEKDPKKDRDNDGGSQVA